MKENGPLGKFSTFFLSSFAGVNCEFLHCETNEDFLVSKTYFTISTGRT